MDMWAWLWDVDDELRENDNHALADYIDDIPSDTCAGRHDKVDKYADEGLENLERLKEIEMEARK